MIPPLPPPERCPVVAHSHLPGPHLRNALSFREQGRDRREQPQGGHQEEFPRGKVGRDCFGEPSLQVSLGHWGWHSGLGTEWGSGTDSMASEVCSSFNDSGILPSLSPTSCKVQHQTC